MSWFKRKDEKPAPLKSADPYQTEVTRAAREVVSRLGKGDGVLTEPVPVQASIDEPETVRSVAVWMFFNPMGPTIARLSLVPLGYCDGSLLVYRARHPFSPDASAWGVFTGAAQSDSTEVCRALVPGFVKRIGGFLSSPPSSVMHEDDHVLSRSDLRTLFATAARHFNGNQVREAVRLMRQHHCKPWDRAGAELRSAVATIAAGRSKAEDAPLTGPEFDLWWNLVTDPRHVAAEWASFPDAWRGAIENVRGTGEA